MSASSIIEFNFTDLLEGVVRIARRNVGALVVYVVFLTLLSLSLEQFLMGEFGIFGTSVPNFAFGSAIFASIALMIIWLGIHITADYFLYRAVFVEADLMINRSILRLLPFVVLSMMVVVASSLGYIVFVIPGLLMTGRWSIASAIYLAENVSIGDAMSSSWSTMNGYARWVVLGYAGALVVSLASAYGMAPAGLVDITQPSFETVVYVLSQVISSACTAAMALIALSAYFSLRKRALDVADVFS